MFLLNYRNKELGPFILQEAVSKGQSFFIKRRPSSIKFSAFVAYKGSKNVK